MIRPDRRRLARRRSLKNLPMNIDLHGFGPAMMAGT
jgi:hypothetical protein